MAIILANNATSKLSGSITAAATSITVQSGEGERFPSPVSPNWFPVTLIDADGNIEICQCTARSGDILTVARGREGTTARAFAAGSRVSLRITKGVLDYVFGVVDQLAGTTISSFAKTMLDDANESTVLSTLGVSSFIKTLLDDADAASALTTLGVSTFIQGLLNDADASSARATLGAQPSDATLTALANLVGVADSLPYFNNSDQMALTSLSGFVRGILGMTNGANICNYINAIKKIDFGYSKAASGYVSIPIPDGSKIYIQWGKTGSISANQSYGVSFPIAFPSTCVAVVTGNPTGGPTNSSVVTTSTPTATMFTMYGDSDTATPNGAYWVAIGY